MEKLKELCEIKHDLIDAVKKQIEKYGVCSPEINTEEMGEVIDMIKDLAKAEKDCIETDYYATVIEAMHGAEERPGYDRWRYASGRYAPKGHGHMSGYTPYPEVYKPHNMIPDYMMDGRYNMDRMGYPNETRSTSGSSYDRYKDARRHYHETRNENDKMVMNHHAQEHVDETVESIRDMWDTADTDTKRKMKGSLSKLVAEMAV